MIKKIFPSLFLIFLFILPANAGKKDQADKYTVDAVAGNSASKKKPVLASAPLHYSELTGSVSSEAPQKRLERHDLESYTEEMGEKLLKAGLEVSTAIEALGEYDERLKRLDISIAKCSQVGRAAILDGRRHRRHRGAGPLASLRPQAR